MQGTDQGEEKRYQYICTICPQS